MAKKALHLWEFYRGRGEWLKSQTRALLEINVVSCAVFPNALITKVYVFFTVKYKKKDERLIKLEKNRNFILL